MKTALGIAGFLSVLLMTEISIAQLNKSKPAILENIGVEEKLGEQIPLDVTFANSEGDSVTISELLEEGKPVLLNPLYYECPMLCGLVLEGVFKVVKELQWNPGEDYTIISFSIDPDETSEHASRSKEKYVHSLNREGAETGWHLLTGNEKNIKKLTEAIGFNYTYDDRTGEYVHAAAISFLSPDGKITRYLYGIEFPEFSLRNALYESADGKIGSSIDRVVLYCFTYDPSSDSYVPVALNIMKVGGLATLIFLGIFLGLFWIREKKSSQTQTFEIEK
jgi:protein SCO1